MKKYMVVYKIDCETNAYFTDDSIKADNFRMDCECGMGGIAQVYKWYPRSGQYKLWYE